MKKEKVLYQIKSLDKLIFREFIKEDFNNSEVSSPPTPTQMMILEYVLKHDNEDVYQKDLENVLNLRRATVSGVLQTMEKHKLIERIIDKEDARIKKIVIMDQAKKIFSMKEKLFYELEESVREGITEDELENFFAVINKMKQNLIKYTLEKKRKDELC